MPSTFSSKYSRGRLLLAFTQAKVVPVVPSPGKPASSRVTWAPLCASRNAVHVPMIPDPITIQRRVIDHPFCFLQDSIQQYTTRLTNWNIQSLAGVVGGRMRGRRAIFVIPRSPPLLQYLYSRQQWTKSYNQILQRTNESLLIKIDNTCQNVVYL